MAEEFLQKFMINLSQNERDFMEWAYHLRMQDTFEHVPRDYYTKKYLSYVDEPLFTSIILSNRWI